MALLSVANTATCLCRHYCDAFTMIESTTYIPCRNPYDAPILGKFINSGHISNDWAFGDENSLAALKPGPVLGHSSLYDFNKIFQWSYLNSFRF